MFGYGRRRAAEVRIHRALAEGRHEGARFRAGVRDEVESLAVAVQRQLLRWRLTPPECRTAFFLLRGLSPSDIAAILRTSERAVQRQARVVYAKSRLRGQAALSTYFLNDLFPF